MKTCDFWNQIVREGRDVFRRGGRGDAMDVREIWGGESAESEFDRERDWRALPSSLAEKGFFSSSS